MTPVAPEAWPAVFGGLIPILGLAAIGYIIYRAVKNDGTGDGDDDNADVDADDGDDSLAT